MSEQARPSDTNSASDMQSQTTVVQRILREPLFQFLVLAGLIFAAQAIFASDDRELIVVDAATQNYLFNQEEELLLRPLSQQEKDEIVKSFIEEEILVREAVKRGFSDGSRIRALLLQNMRFFVSGNLPEPTDDELKAYFEANPEQFTSPPSFDLQHVMYNAGSDVPPDVLQKLMDGADPNQMGDNDVTFGGTLRFMDQKRFVQAFGGDTAKAVLDALAQSDDWHGPFESQTGSVHFLKVVAENPPQLPDFEQAKDWISAQWMSDKSRQLMEQELQTIESGYRIEIETLNEAGNGA